MPRRNSRLQFFLFLISALVLVVGFVGAVVVYENAIDDDMKDAIGFEFVGGKAYPILPQDTKRYEYDLERFGGKFAVLADKFNRWFASLWRGKSLAYILAFFSIGISFVCFQIARELTFHAGHDRSEKHDA